MSRNHREKRIFPANFYARYIWLLYGLWEEIFDLAEIYKDTREHQPKVIIARHLLIDFDSLDELIKELHQHIKESEIEKLSVEDRTTIDKAYSEYHRTIEPYRQQLKEIRNNGAHRRGMPWKKFEKYETYKDVWGKWEQHLVRLEASCDLTNWVDALNAALSLIYLLSDFNLDSWYTFSDDGEFKTFSPVLQPGYYPIGGKE